MRKSNVATCALMRRCAIGDAARIFNNNKKGG